MPKSVSQFVILIITCFALISQVWADTVMVCDMEMEHDSNHSEMTGAMSHQDHQMMGHDILNHQMDSKEASDDAGVSVGDCCDNDCNCQHGVCPNLLFLNQSVLITIKPQETVSFGFTPNAALAIFIPSPFKPPIV